MAKHDIQVSRSFGLPIEVLTETTAVLGRRGSGKTNTGVVIAEGLLKHGQQVVILDPLDVWFGLRSNKSGKGRGFDVLLVGDPRKPHTDVPLEEHDGAALADYLIDERVPCILSMRHLSKAGRKRFTAAFAERTYERRGDPGKDSPCLYIIDEASTFVPQRVMGPDARLVGAIESWVRQGRASGIGVMLIDQRAASVNKDVLTQVELMIVHQLNSPQDRKALEAWIEANDIHDQRGEFMKSLARLTLGEAWFWSPAWLKCFEQVQVKLRDTFDSSATPKAGDARVVPTGGAAFDIDQIKGQLAKTIEHARANDPAQLKRRIAELEKQIKNAGPVVDQSAIDRAVLRAVGDRDREWHTAWKWLLGKIGSHARDLNSIASDGIPDISPASGTVLIDRKPDKPSVPATRHSRVKTTTYKAPAIADADTSLNDTQRKMLAVLLHRQQMNQQTTPRSMLAAMAGVKASGGTFGTYLSRLRTAGYIDGSSELWITDAGVAALGPVEPLPTGAELIDWYKQNKLNSTQSAMLDAIVRHHPNGIERQDLASAVELEPGGGTYGTYLSRMRQLGIIRGSGLLSLTDAVSEGL